VGDLKSALSGPQFRGLIFTVSVIVHVYGESLQRRVVRDHIQDMKDLTMVDFESVVGSNAGCECHYITEQDCIKYVDWDLRRTSIYFCYVI